MDKQVDRYILSKEKLIGKVSIHLSTDLVGHEELTLMSERRILDYINNMLDEILDYAKSVRTPVKSLNPVNKED